MKIETVGHKIGFLTGIVVFITVFYFVVSLKFEWMSSYLSYYNALFIAIDAYILYLIIHGVYRRWKK